VRVGLVDLHHHELKQRGQGAVPRMRPGHRMS
jgi:hypothetical protein